MHAYHTAAITESGGIQTGAHADRRRLEAQCKLAQRVCSG